MDDTPIQQLVLVGSAGIQPQQGEIADVFVLTWPEVIQHAFHDPAPPSKPDRPRRMVHEY